MLAKITNNITLRSMAYGVLSVWIASVGLAGVFVMRFDFNNPNAIPVSAPDVFIRTLLRSMELTTIPGAVAALLLSILFRTHAVQKKLSAKIAVLVGVGFGVFIIWSLVEFVDFWTNFRISWEAWIFWIVLSGILAAPAGGWTAWQIYRLINPRKMTKTIVVD